MLSSLIIFISITIVILAILFLLFGFFTAIFRGGPFVPTPMYAVEKILETAKIKKGEKVYDIGAGDGRLIHFAEKKYGAKATGFEIDPFVFMLAKLRQLFWRWKGKMIRSNFLKYNISDADVLVCYMLPKSLARFQKKFDKELKKGTRIISYAFHIGDWKPKKIIKKNGKISQIFLYEKS